MINMYTILRSAMVRTLPRVCETVKVNLTQNRWILAGNSSRFFTPSNETKSLWSVSA